MKTILVTGATGALGSALVPVLLQDPENQVRLVVRAESDRHLAKRVEDLFAFWDLADAEPSGRHRLRAFRGDVSQRKLGLNDSDYRELGRQVTHVVHAAGNVRLNQPLDLARKSALDATRQILEFIAACRELGTFRKLEFVSTVGVGGTITGSVPERALPNVPGFHNTYEQAKAEAETLLWQEIDKGLPATVHRPSMVVGDSSTGKIIHYQVFYHLAEFFAGFKTNGLVPQAGNVQLDIIPSDYVARAICLSMDAEDATGRVFHLCSGAKHSCFIRDLVIALRTIFSRFDASLPQLEQLPLSEFRRTVVERRGALSESNQRFLDGLPYLLDYLEEEQTFANTESDTFFSQRGLNIPPVQDYLPQVIGRYWDWKASRSKITTNDA